MSVEFIRFAAVQVNTTVFSGKNHSECLKKLKSSTQQGFIADQYGGSRFVGRKEALEIAIIAGQKIDKHAPKDK